MARYKQLMLRVLAHLPIEAIALRARIARWKMHLGSASATSKSGV